jgi:phage shock protein E
MLTYILLALFVGFAFAFFIRSSGGKNYTNLSIKDLIDLMKNSNTVLIDVRTPKETRQGMIGKPLEIELGSGMEQKFSSLDKDKKYVLYCRSGRRSVLASNMMTKMGFTDVNNLLGGYLAWQSNK